MAEGSGGVWAFHGQEVTVMMMTLTIMSVIFTLSWAISMPIIRIDSFTLGTL